MNDDDFDDKDGKLDQLVALSGSVIVEPTVVTDTEAEDVRRRIRAVSQQVEDSYLELGSLFYAARKDMMFLRWVNPATGQPYKDWDDYVNHESGFSTRSINYMIAIYWWFSALRAFPVIKETIRDIGWKKARALVGVADDKNWEAWFERAKVRSAPRLEHETRVALRRAGISQRPTPGLPAHMRPDPNGVQPEPEPAVESKIESDINLTGVGKVPVVALDATPKAEAPPPDTGKRADGPREGPAPPSSNDMDQFDREVRSPWGVQLTQEQKDHVGLACKIAWDVLSDTDREAKRKTRDTISYGEALSHIATHFLTFYSGAAAQVKEDRHRMMLADLIAGIEKNFDVDLVAVDRSKGAGRIVHGKPEDFFRKVEKKLGVSLVVLRQGTNEVIFGEETIKAIEESEES